MRGSVLGALVALLAATGCQAVLPDMPGSRPARVQARYAFLENGAASNQDEFRDLCDRQGIRLEAAQLHAIAQATTILPNGRWRPTWAAAKQDLAGAALTFARQRDATVGFYFDADAFRARGIVSVVRWEARQGQYLILAADGTIDDYRPGVTTPAAGWVRIPSDLMPGAH